MAATPKRRLEALLRGEIPDEPPHWELVFQIPKEMFGIDVEGSTDPRTAYGDVADRLIDECGWAAVPPIDAWDPVEVGLAKERYGERALVPGYENNGVFWMLPGSEMEEFAIRLFEDREGLHREAREKCETAKVKMRAQADHGADFFVLTYDFGYNQAPFVSPEHFNDICLPYLSELVALAHDLGRRAILHSDGCIDLLLDAIVDAGVDGYQSVDPQGHMDIADVRRRYPELLLMGNVPCSLLQERDDEAIREAVKTCMDHGGYGQRYVFSTSNCIFAGMPPDSYRQMLAEYRGYIRERQATR